MPALDCRIIPARSISLWETISASLGVSRRTGRKYRDNRMEPRWIVNGRASANLCSAAILCLGRARPALADGRRHIRFMHGWQRPGANPDTANGHSTGRPLPRVLILYGSERLLSPPISVFKQG